ncbi:MAG: DUF2147 domain-containing protein [Alphaproteobacteria bacterium]
MTLPRSSFAQAAPGRGLGLGAFFMGVAVAMVLAGPVAWVPLAWAQSSETSDAAAETAPAPEHQAEFPDGTPSREERLALAPVPDSMGIYAREGADTRIELYPCEDNELCGRIVWLRRLAEADGSVRKDLKNPDPDLQSRRLMGMMVLWGLERKDQQADKWVGGRIYNPDDGKDYKARLAFRDDEAVELQACIFLLCKTQIWRPHESAPVKSDRAQSGDGVSPETQTGRSVE